MSLAYWIAGDENPSRAAEYRFTRRFRTREGTSFTARISADARYRLYLNGHSICDGPCVSSPFHRHYEEANLSPFLKPGRNEILVRVLCLPCKEDIFTTVPRLGIPCLWFDGLLTEGETKTPILSDGTFRCHRVDSISFRPVRGRGLHTSVYPFEDHEKEVSLTPVPVRLLYQPQNVRFDLYGRGEPFPLSPRPIPLLSESDPQPFTVIRKEHDLMDLDAGRYTTAYPVITVRGTPGSRLTIRYAECYQRKDGAKDLRDDTTGELCGPYDTIILNGRKQRFSPFFFRAFRFIRLEGDIASLTLYPSDCTYSDYYYPFEESGRFSCSDPALNAMRSISRQTLLCCTHETFVDSPFYEMRQYILDSYLEMHYAFAVSADRRPAAKALTDLADSQRPDGMLNCHFPSEIVQVISGFSLYWVLMLRDYYLYTADLDLVHRLFGTLLKVMEAYENRIDRDGLLSPHDSWQYVDGIPEWYIGAPNDNRDEPILYECLQYAYACQAAAELADCLGKAYYAEAFRKRKQSLFDAVELHGFDREVGMYRDTPTLPRFSRHTAVMAVLSGAVIGKAAIVLLRRTMQNAPIRCSFSLNWFTLRALQKTGLYDEFADSIFDGWRAMISNHCTTWCENPGHCRSECHGWSSAPLYETAAVILGVTPESPGFASARIQPDFRFGNLSFAEGSVPTPFGSLSVRWTRSGEKIRLSVKSPDGHPIPLTICLPGKAPLKKIGEADLSLTFAESNLC